MATALLQPGALILLVSRSLRQSQELFRKVIEIYWLLGSPLPTVQESALQTKLSNGSRIVSLPGSEETIRGYSGVALLIIDEAARVRDDLYRSLRPMLAVSGGTLVALSTPFGQRGWFFEEWESNRAWERTKVTADECPRIESAFLEEEKEALGLRWYLQEYFCNFSDSIDSVFAHGDIMAAVAEDVQPLFMAL